MTEIPKGYIAGLDRSEWGDSCVAHLYKGTFDAPERPMCAYGWNRSNGFGWSIFRNNIGRKGICKICARRVKAGLEPVEPRERKTTYI